MNVQRASTGLRVQLNSMDRLASLHKRRNERRKRQRKRQGNYRTHSLPPIAVNTDMRLITERYIERAQSVLPVETKVKKIARISIIISLILHIVAFSIFAFVKLYYREIDIGDEIPVTFMKSQKARLPRRSALIRPMVSISRSPQNLSQKQAISRPDYKSSEVFYTDAPEQTFSIVRSIEREGFSGQIIPQLPPIKKMRYKLSPTGTEVLKETKIPEMQVQPRVISGSDFLKEMSPIQPKPSLNNILQSFAQTVRRKIESRKRYPLTARKSMIEGKVGVKMTILKDGRLEAVEIIETSGYAILDKAALESVRRAAPFPPLPEEADRNRIQMSIYLVFKMA